MTDLKYPKSDEAKEDPAILAARNSLKKRETEPAPVKIKHVKHCWGCGKKHTTDTPVKQRWINRLKTQR